MQISPTDQEPSGLKPIELLKPGTYTSVEGEKVTYTRDDLVELAESYNAARDPAPLVVGHPRIDDPAMGWAKSISVNDAGVLVALPDQVAPAFAEAVNAGAFRKISVQIYPRGHVASPTPGKLALKHIGFFGAHPVAVKGLRPVSFSEAQQAGCNTVETDFHSPKKETIMADPKPKDVDSFAEREAALVAREAAVKESEAALAAQRTADLKAASDARHADHVSFAEGLIKELKFAPAAKDGLIHVLDVLGEPGVQSFGEGEAAQSPLAIIKGWFESANPIVSLGEAAADPKKGDQQASGLVSFAAPSGFSVDQASLDHHNRATALQAENPKLSYAEAVRRTKQG